MDKDELRLMAEKRRGSLAEQLDYLVAKGSSVTLNWGEDTGAWEATWISGGVRHGGVGAAPQQAIFDLLTKVIDKFL